MRAGAGREPDGRAAVLHKPDPRGPSLLASRARTDLTGRCPRGFPKFPVRVALLLPRCPGPIWRSGRPTNPRPTRTRTPPSGPRLRPPAAGRQMARAPQRSPPRVQGVRAGRPGLETVAPGVLPGGSDQTNETRSHRVACWLLACRVGWRPWGFRRVVVSIHQAHHGSYVPARPPIASRPH